MKTTVDKILFNIQSGAKLCATWWNQIGWWNNWQTIQVKTHWIFCVYLRRFWWNLRTISNLCLQICGKYGEFELMENAYHLAEILIVFQLSPSFLPKLKVLLLSQLYLHTGETRESKALRKICCHCYSDALCFVWPANWTGAMWWNRNSNSTLLNVSDETRTRRSRNSNSTHSSWEKKQRNCRGLFGKSSKKRKPLSVVFYRKGGQGGV